MFTVEIDASDFTQDLAAIQKGMSDGTLMKVLGDVIVNTYLPEVFSTEGSVTGQKWAPTIRGEGILWDTGTLSKSFAATVNGPEVVIGNTQRYFPTHELGMTIRAKNKPYLVFRLRGTGSTATSTQSSGAMADADKRARGVGKADSSPTGQWRKVKQVTIPQRSSLRVSDVMIETISDQCADWIDENWGKR